MARVLIVEDSATAGELIRSILVADPDLQVIGEVRSGEEALAFVANDRPDVITMDIMLPGMDGIEATRRIMQSVPVPIVVVSGHLPPAEEATVFRALEAGALAVVRKPAGLSDSRDVLLRVKAMAEVRVIRRYPRRPRPRDGDRACVASAHAAPPVQIVAIGGSTGAPVAIQRILARLPAGVSVPVVIVQHMAPGFTVGMARWLADSTRHRVELATDGVRLRPGCVYLAPEGLQTGIGAPGIATVTDAPAEHGLRPSVSYLFRSVAAAFGPRAAGVLLSGMGNDGAAELAELRRRGALTIAQDRESSVVHGMPGAAMALGGASLVLPPEEIAAAIVWAMGCGAAPQVEGP